MIANLLLLKTWLGRTKRARACGSVSVKDSDAWSEAMRRFSFDVVVRLRRRRHQQQSCSSTRAIGQRADALRFSARIPLSRSATSWSAMAKTAIPATRNLPANAEPIRFGVYRKSQDLSVHGNCQLTIPPMGPKKQRDSIRCNAVRISLTLYLLTHETDSGLFAPK